MYINKVLVCIRMTLFYPKQKQQDLLIKYKYKVCTLSEHII